ncbi:MAG: hypothetical protein R3350_08810 [Saprospiraceae bacterium]|nr:hypothetical protein [Saprospiraceae bacterium]
MLKDKSHVSTVDHDEIKSWAESRKARPVQIQKFEGENILDRVKFRFPSERFPEEEDLTWEQFFEIFDEERLEFVFEDIADEAVEDQNIYQFRPRAY